MLTSTEPLPQPQGERCRTLSSTHLQALSTQCNRKMPQWQKAASASLQPCDCQDGALTTSLTTFCKKGTIAHKACGAVLSELKGLKAWAGRGCSQSVPQTPQRSSAHTESLGREAIPCCPRQLFVSSRLSQESASVLMGKRGWEAPQALTGRFAKGRGKSLRDPLQRRRKDGI